MVSADDHRPTLKAIILDFSSVDNVDITSVNTLIDVRNQLNRYASPNLVEWHFACINQRWTKRALISAGFGYPTPATYGDGHFQRWKPIYSVAEIGGSESAAEAEEISRNKSEIERSRSRPHHDDIESQGKETGVGSKPAPDNSDEDSLDRQIAASKGYGVSSRATAVVGGINMPLFYPDLTSAVQGAISSVQEKERSGVEVKPEDIKIPGQL